MQNLNVSQNKETNNFPEDHEDVDSKSVRKNPSMGSTSMGLHKIASAAGRLTGNLGSQPGVVDGFFDKLKVLEREWHHAEKRYKNLQIENDKIVTQLESERTKCSVLQKKLKFIQDNHKNFERLKQVYLNMRYQESVEKSKADIQEKCSQTIDSPPPDVTTIMSSLSRDSLVSVKKSELAEAQENLKSLKEMVKKREESWAMNMHRERTYKEHISILQHENEMLNQLMKVKDMEIKTMRITEEMNSKAKEEIGVYKRIIGKMDKKLRELDKCGKTSKSSFNFDDKERRFFEEIIYKNLTSTKPMDRLRTRSLSPSKLAVEQAALVPISKQVLKISGKAKSEKHSLQKEGSLGEIQELEFLTRVKREIERKQANLKERARESSTDISKTKK